MTYAGMQMFMEKLKQLINCNDNPLFNNPEIICERPQFQLLYEQLGTMIQTLFIDQHKDIHEYHKLMKKRLTDAAEEAQYIVDLFVSGVHIRNMGHFPTSEDFKSSLNLDDVWRSFESVKVELMSVALRYGDNFEKYFPCIKELRCNLQEGYDFKSLTNLETLKLTVQHGPRRMKSNVLDSPKGCGMNHITFPATLKTLTLAMCRLPWSCMSIIQSLPNLEVLKLQIDAFMGSCWNTYKQEFRQLIFLRLNNLFIKQWEGYSTSFPCLRQLEVISCKLLEEIPLEIGDIPTLEIIKIKSCSHSCVESVRRIPEEQHDSGNYDPKVDVNGFDDLSL
ncbi:hypothetical protein L1987_38184 [Smallanthus sonchifolius]|uniref:Uncharacterized protein n=1 Tax=Smallanthus sonchifolius TaxID=185202 RepID=A0ACB9HIH7_9ASTR|nr:hypothetical protein L1987_38184 [Smallanthus sonchifolius]